MKLLYCALYLFAFIQPLSALTVSLDALPSRVRSENPSLKAARLAVEEARGRLLGAGRKANPTASYEFQNQSKVSPQTGVVSFEQTFPLTQRLRLEKQLSAQLVEAVELEVREAERQIILTAQEHAVRLLALSQQQALRQQQMKLAAKLSEFVQARSKAGEMSALDARQVQLDAQRLAVESRLLEAKSVTELGALKPLLGLMASDSLAISGQLLDIALPKNQTWQSRPDYQLAQRKISLAETEKQIAVAKRRPDLTAGVFAAHEMQDVTATQRQRTGFVGFKLSLPLPLWNKNEGEIAEKTASAKRAQLETDVLRSKIESEADTARRELTSHAALVRETRETLLPLTIENMEAQQKAYESGQADLLSVLRARDQRLQIEASALDAVRDFHLVRVRYEAVTAQH